MPLLESLLWTPETGVVCRRLGQEVEQGWVVWSKAGLQGQEGELVGSHHCSLGRGLWRGEMGEVVLGGL